jgi:addiction module RelE/StbE family toxin
MIMEVIYRRKFRKAFKKQSKKTHIKFFEKLEIFKKDPFHYSLNNHTLSGEFKGVRSFDITGDIRVHYVEANAVAVFLMIGSHSELYS